MVTKSGQTTVHLRDNQYDKIVLMRSSYIHKTKVVISLKDFVDYVLEAAEKALNEMPTIEVVDGKIVEVKPENVEQ